MMDGAGRHEASHHAHKEPHHHHHATQHAAHNSDKFDSEVYAAHDAWAAWKSHDPAAWDAALDLRDKISPKAWRHAMHEIDLEEAAQKKKHAEHLPQVTIQSDERVALGGSSSRVPSGRNYYDGSQVPGYYEGPQQRAQGNRTYIEQQHSVSEYGYQTNQYRTPNPPVDQSYGYDRYVVPQTRSYLQNDVYQYDAQSRSYYPSRNSSYYPDQNYGYRDQDYRFYPQNSGYYREQDYRYYPHNSGNYGYDQYPGNYAYGNYGGGYYGNYGGGYGNYGYGGYGNYGYGRQNVGAWLGPVIGGSAGALFDRHNRWRGTVIGSALGSVLGSVVQNVSQGGFGTGYGGYGIYY